MIEPIRDTFLQAGLIDLDGTFVFQLAVFAVFAIMLNLLVVRPMIRTQGMRFARMAGARKDAEVMDLRAAEAHTHYEGQIDEARKGAVTIREDLKQAADQKARAMLDGVRTESERSLDAGRGVLAEQAATVEADMEAQVEELARLIADRIVPQGGEKAS